MIVKSYGRSGGSGISFAGGRFDLISRPRGLSLVAPRSVIIAGGIALDQATLRFVAPVQNTGGQTGQYGLELIVKTGGIEQRRTSLALQSLGPGGLVNITMQLVVNDTDRPGGVEGICNLLGSTGAILATKSSGSIGTVESAPATFSFSSAGTWSLGF